MRVLPIQSIALRRALGLLLLLLLLAGGRLVAGKLLGPSVLRRETARFERELGPLDPGRFAEPPIAERENGATAIAAVASRIDLSLPDHTLLSHFGTDELPAQDFAALDRLLAAHAADLRELAQAAALPRSSFGPLAQVFARSDAQSLPNWLIAARLVAADGRRALAAGDEARLDRDLAALHGITRALRRVPLALFAMIGESVEAIELDLLRSTLATPRTPWLLTGSATRLAELGALPDFRAVLTGEAVLGFAAMRDRLFPSSGDGTPSERRETVGLLWSKEHLLAGGLPGWVEVARLVRRPQTSWPPEPANAGSRTRFLQHLLDPTLPFDEPGRLVASNMETVARRRQLVDSAERLAITAVGLELAGRADGSYPASLAGLAHGAPVDAASGEAARYERRPDGGAEIAFPTAQRLAAASAASGTSGSRGSDLRRVRILSWTLPNPSTR